VIALRTRIARWGTALAIAVVVPAAERPLHAQADALDSRLEQVAGIRADAASMFFERLRRAVGMNDRAAACALVTYPLRHPDGDVADAAACEARYEAIFTVAVRRAVGRQQWKELFVTDGAVLVGNGEVWFAARCATRPCGPEAVRITVVNSGGGLQPPRGKVLIACRVSGQAVTVTADGSGGAELRMWRTESPSGPPAVEVLRGTPTPQATGQCAWRAWSFPGPDTTFTVAEVACMPVVVPAPFGTFARVSRSTPGAPGDEAWCFE
jgi:hypothetical protein